MRRPTYLLSLLLLLLASGLCWAQTTHNQGAIIGRVTDTSGAVVSGAKVTVRSVSTGIEQTTTSNDYGDYALDFVKSGEYSVTAELSGFRKAVITGVQVRAGERPRVDLELAAGDIQETVTVESTAAPLTVDSATMGVTVTDTLFQQLPLARREALRVAALAPGAWENNPGRGQHGSKGFSIGFNGAWAQHNSYYVDGADVNTGNNTLATSPAVEAIKEVRIDTNMTSVQKGRSAAGVIDIITKSGTNEWHGSAFEYHRNIKTDALPWRFTGQRDELSHYHYNNFGGTLGGPIIKNKTFIFGSVDLFREIRPGRVRLGFSPTEAERRGDLTNTINRWSTDPPTLRNPFTLEPLETLIWPQELINPIGRQMMDELWPLPTEAGLGSHEINLIKFLGGPSNRDRYLVRGDHHFSNNDTVFGTFDWSEDQSHSVLWTEYADTASTEKSWIATGTYTHVFSPNLVNDFKANYLFWRNVSGPYIQDRNAATEDFGFHASGHKASGMPALYMYGPTGILQLGTVGNTGNETRTVMAKDALVWTKGRHTFLLGGDFRWQESSRTELGGAFGFGFGFQDGNPSFTPDGAAGVDGQVTGNMFSSFLATTPEAYYPYYGDGSFVPMKRNAFSIFFSDKWNVSPRLTLDLGLRYDYEEPFTQTAGEFITLNFNTGSPRYCRDLPALQVLKFDFEIGGNCRPYEPNKLNFAPRVGFAFRPFDDAKTVVRGGYGVFFSPADERSTIRGSQVAPFSGWAGYFSTMNGWPDERPHPFSLDQEVYGLDIVLGASPGQVWVNPPNFPDTYLQNWNVTLGRDLGWQTAAELAYVGSRGVHIGGASNIGVLNPALAAKITEDGVWSSQLVRTKDYSSKYHGLQVRFRKETSHGLSFLSHYTWGKATGDSGYDTGGLGEHISFRDSASGEAMYFRQWALTQLDTRHRFVFTGTWDLPLGRGRAVGSNWHPVVNGILGGWRVTPIYTASTGLPWSVKNRIGGQYFADRLCDGNLPRGQRTRERWFDVSCFAVHQPEEVAGPNAGETRLINFQGNSGPNIITGPGMSLLDLGLHKDFRFREDINLTLRAEFFNAFNHVNFQAPAWVAFTVQSLANPGCEKTAGGCPGASIQRALPMRTFQLGLVLRF